MRTDNSDYDEDDYDDPDAPLVSDLDHAHDDDDDMVCPACGRGVAIDTPKCPHCGDWIRPVTPDGGTWGRVVKVVVIVMLALGALQLLAIFN